MTYYAAVVQVVQFLKAICHDDHGPYRDFDSDKQLITRSLYQKFILLQNLLEYCSSNHNEAANELETRIRDAAYCAKNIIKSHIVEEKTEKTHTVQRFFYPPIFVMCPQRRPEVDGLKRVEEEVDSILDALRIKIRYASGRARYIGSFSNSRVDYIGSKYKYAPAGSSTMVGFDEHLIPIKEQLCGGSYERQTIPITGMGGMGKTTLARHIFNDKLIVDHFDVRAWVTISQDYNNINMLRAILDSINAGTQESSRGLSSTQLQIDIHQKLIHRRYLIIVDDVWSINVLDDIKRVSKDDYNGSRIVITTRLSDVAAYDKKFGAPLHQMQSLNEEQSWKLFRKKVFAQEEGCVCPPELEEPGKSIVRNCSGLPLAIVVIAGVLSKVKRTRRDWNEIASNVNSVVAKNDEDFSRILSLSYNHLPHHLKQCFLYIGSFPEDHQISASKLIRLWMAEGFLNTNPVLIEEPSSSIRRSLEEVGEEYLEDLVKRNLILVTKKSRYNGKIEVCGIHNLLRDLCQKRVRSEYFFDSTYNYKYAKLSKHSGIHVRHVCLYPYFNNHYFSNLYSSSRIVEAVSNSSTRSTLCFGEYLGTNWNISSGCFKLLRVLDGLQIEFESFPDTVLELFHLRYLALYLHPTTKSITGKPIIRISSSISQLQNLQTFIIETYADKLCLPSEMWRMPQLRHVLIDRLNMLPPPPSFVRLYAAAGGGIPGGGVLLENLQTLSGVENFRFTEEAVAMMPNLKTLKVVHSMHMKWERLSAFANLRELEELDIYTGSITIDFPANNDYSGFGVFPHNLKKLTLRNCKIPWEMMSSVVGCLPNLEVLQLLPYSMTGSKWETKQGEFQSLKFLQMDDLDLVCWKVADYTHFPCLVQLEIKSFWKLEEIPLEIGDIPTLQLIQVNKCGKSATESARLIQEEQQIDGNDTLQVMIDGRYYNAS